MEIIAVPIMEGILSNGVGLVGFQQLLAIIWFRGMFKSL